MLAAQPFPIYITTNPDSLLEAALEGEQKAGARDAQRGEQLATHELLVALALPGAGVTAHLRPAEDDRDREEEEGGATQQVADDDDGEEGESSYDCLREGAPLLPS